MLHGWVTSELQSILSEKGVTFTESPVSPGQLVSLVQAVQKGCVSRLVAKEVTINDTLCRVFLNCLLSYVHRL